MRVFTLFVSSFLVGLLSLGLSFGLSAEEAGISPENVREYFKNEPSIEEIQKAAIEYAEVQPEKISSWRKNVAVKALLPEVSLDYDKTIYHYASATIDRTVVGPYDWGINLKWDLADFIWNPSQTSIDIRSRLMVKLRNNILGKVNELYFERRKLQIEFLLEPAGNPRKRLKRELRIKQLTADIDGLTGGYLSQKLKNM